LEILFPGYNGTVAIDSDLTADDREALPELDWLHWGWIALEKGLRALSQQIEHLPSDTPSQPADESPPFPVAPQSPAAGTQEREHSRLAPADAAPAETEQSGDAMASQPDPVVPKETKRKRLPQPWAHTEPADPQIYSGGRMEGHLKDLALWMGVDPRTLRKMNKDKQVHIQKMHGKKWVVNFSTNDQYNDACRKQKQLKEKADKETQ
jgi:hypothetical protein